MHTKTVHYECAIAFDNTEFTGKDCRAQCLAYEQKKLQELYYTNSDKFLVAEHDDKHYDKYYILIKDISAISVFNDWMNIRGIDSDMRKRIIDKLQQNWDEYKGYWFTLSSQDDYYWGIGISVKGQINKLQKVLELLELFEQGYATNPSTRGGNIEKEYALYPELDSE